MVRGSGRGAERDGGKDGGGDTTGGRLRGDSSQQNGFYDPWTCRKGPSEQMRPEVDRTQLGLTSYFAGDCRKVVALEHSTTAILHEAVQVVVRTYSDVK